LQAPQRAEQRQGVTIQSIAGLIRVAGRAYDFVVADIGVVNAGDWALVLQEAQAILLVAEPSALALGMIDRHLAAATRAGVERGRIHMVVNRWRQNDDDPVAAFEKSFGWTALSRLPNDYRQVTEAVQLAMPLMGSGNNPLLARYRELATRLASEFQDSPRPEATTAKSIS
jgi:Flp pilus assembly CpaE family ATPase